MLGQMLGSLRDYLDLDEEVDECFDLALKARNRLIHGFINSLMGGGRCPGSRGSELSDAPSLRRCRKKETGREFRLVSRAADVRRFEPKRYVSRVTIGG